MLKKDNQNQPCFFFIFFIKPSIRSISDRLCYSFGTQNGPAFLHKIQQSFAKKNKDKQKGDMKAAKSQTAGSKKTIKNTMIFNVFQSKELPKMPQKDQRSPKDIQETSKTPYKKMTKKIQKNAAVVKNALSRRSQKTRFLEPIFMTKFALFQIEFI